MSSFPSVSDSSTVTDQYVQLTGVSLLIDSCLNALCAEKLFAPADVFARVMTEMQKSRTYFFEQTVRRFESTVAELSDVGFGTAINTYMITFAVPRLDGTLFELVPLGRHITVTPNNYERFCAVYRVFKEQRPSKVDAEFARCVQPHMPVSASALLLSPHIDFSDVLDFLRDALLPGSSPWTIENETVWNALGITYAIPWSGCRLPVTEGKSVNDPVPFNCAAAYVRDAEEKLRRTAVHKTVPAALPATGAETMSAPRQHHSALQYISEQQREGEQQQKMREQQQQQLQQLRQSPAEKNFWDRIEEIWRDPTQLECMALSFALSIGDSTIMLKPNGKYVPVTPENVGEFHQMVRANERAIHEAFEQLGRSLERLIAANPIERAREWNAVDLTAEDVQGSYVTNMLMLRDCLARGTVAESDIVNELDGRFTFIVPRECAAGPYLLLPGGNHLPIFTIGDFHEFLRRLACERERVLAAAASAPRRVVSQGGVQRVRLERQHLPQLEAALQRAREAVERGESLTWRLPVPGLGVELYMRSPDDPQTVRGAQRLNYVKTAELFVDEIQGSIEEEGYCDKQFVDIQQQQQQPAQQVAPAGGFPPRGAAYPASASPPPGAPAGGYTPLRPTAPSDPASFHRTPSRARMHALEFLQDKAMAGIPEDQRNTLFSPTHGLGGLFSPMQYNYE